MVSPIVYYNGWATFGLPSGIGSVVRMPSRIWEGDDFEMINLDLKPHLVSLLLLGRGGHRATPLKRLRSLCLDIYWNQ